MKKHRISKKERQINLYMVMPAELKHTLIAQALPLNMNLSEYIRSILVEVSKTFTHIGELPEGLTILPKSPKPTREDVI